MEAPGEEDIKNIFMGTDFFNICLLPSWKLA